MDLSLREACNKIIHVREIKYELIDGDYEWKRFLKPIVYLYGQKQVSTHRGQAKKSKWANIGGKLSKDISGSGYQVGGYQDSRVSGKRAEDGKQRSEDRISGLAKEWIGPDHRCRG